MLPMTLRLLNRLKCWNTMPTFSRTLFRSVFLSVRSWPSTTTSPPVISSSRLRHRRKVDLPDPDGPRMTTTAPSQMSAETSLSTSRLPKFFFRWETWIVTLFLFTATVQSPFHFLGQHRQRGDDDAVRQRHDGQD